MNDARLLCQCLELTKHLTDRKQEVFMDIRIGDFKFTFDTKKYVKKVEHKSPSQIRRNYFRQKEFQIKLEGKETAREAFENNGEDDRVFKREATVNNKVETKSAESQTNFATLVDVDTQTEEEKVNVAIQTEEIKVNAEINEKGEVVPELNEKIFELKFSHDMKTWEEIKIHIIRNLKLKILGSPWLANNGKHFKTIGFKILKPDFERWKMETLGWENIVRPVTLSRIYK